MNLIDKAALVAEIEKIMNEQQEICKSAIAQGKDPDPKNIEVIYQFQQLIKSLNTLKAKKKVQVPILLRKLLNICLNSGKSQKGE